MRTLNDKESVLNQYSNDNNLNTRISIHEKYSVNKQGFGNWIVSNYQIEEGMRVLELGCGNGLMWCNHKDRIEKCAELVLTDFSEGMLRAAHTNVGELPNVTYRVVDIQDIPYEANSFDVVIANMMLYHVPDLALGLSEVARVLKPKGKFYCATGGERTIMRFVADLLERYGVVYDTNNNFTLQNGKQKLAPHFASVKILEYIDALEVTNIGDLMDYIYSGITWQNACHLPKSTVRQVLEKNMLNGILRIPKECGMFICE